ncbi:MAG: tRNA (guanosine(46)-N7)-methyltransferase TrmB [Pseudomonadota bacterium]|nr:tRNA (guanosine(46)-N7)-methyltransferase TrmB [Pseudomonadota bacterium]
MGVDNSTVDPNGEIRLKHYGRRRGKGFSKRKHFLLSEILPRMAPKGVSNEENPFRKKIKFAEVFGRDCPVWVEVGFGGGEHLIHLARKYSNVGFIGCEPYENGVAKIVQSIFDKKISNVKVIMNDVRNFFSVTPDASVAKVFLLFPDPWPKKKHIKRRFIDDQNLESLRRILQPGGKFYLATDSNDYVRHSIAKIMCNNDFEWLANSRKDWVEPWDDWIDTRYFKKARRSGKVCTFLVFQRKNI